MAAAMGLALWEKALRNPPPDVAPHQTAADRDVIAGLRKRLMLLRAADVRHTTAFFAAMSLPDGIEAIGRRRAARLGAYRTARQLLDLTVQGLTQMQVVFECGSAVFWADGEAAWRLQAAAMEAAFAVCEDHLRELDPAVIVGEPEALAQQIARGRELQGRAQGGLSWRRGRTT